MKTPHIINDFDKIKTVYDKTQDYLNKHPVLHEKISTLLWAYNEIGGVIPQTVDKFWSGHYFPYTESYYELENSFQFCCMGFYRHSFIALRIVLELGLLSVYWDKEDKSHIDIQNWRKAKEDTPFRRKIWEGLLKVDNIKKYIKQVNLESQLKALWEELSNFIHTKDVMYSSTGMTTSNFNQFNEKALTGWIKIMEQIVKINCAIHFLKYPVGLQYTPVDDKFGLNGPMGGFLNPYQQKNIIIIFDNKRLKILQKISDNDEDGKNLAAYINNKPDITREEFDKQIIDFDKDWIKRQGWDSWHNSEMLTIQSIENAKKIPNKEEQINIVKKRIAKLRKWAKKKNYL